MGLWYILDEKTTQVHRQYRLDSHMPQHIRDELRQEPASEVFEPCNEVREIAASIEKRAIRV